MLPKGFTAIKNVKDATTTVSLIGVIVSAKEPRKSRGTDWDDFTTGSIGADSTIACRMFAASHKLPKVTGAGDVALLRNFKPNSWHGRTDVMTHFSSGVLIFPSDRIPVPELSQAYQAGSQQLFCSAMPGTREPSIHEQMTVIQLKHAASSSAQQVKQYAAVSSARFTAPDKLLLIKDLDFNRFYNIRAQVVNIYYLNQGTVDLKVTDYTTNKDLFLYVDPDDEDYAFQRHDSWKGPYGQMTINVILYGNNASWARENLTTGDYIFLKNVHTKMSPANKLEGALHEDRARPDQIDVRKLLNSSDIKELDRRREEYEKSRTKKSAFEQLQNASKQPSEKTSAKSKAEKKARQKLCKEQEQEELKKKNEEWDAARSGLNLNIRAGFPETQPSTLSEIIYNSRLTSQTPKYNDFTYPFLNCKHRSRVRVIDFFPPELELFAHCTNDPSWDKRANPSKKRWEWGFVLRVEDAKVASNTVSEKLRVFVGNEAGQHLLDMDAKDLKSNPKHLSRLEEKLFILWGNLLELKTELRDKGTDMPLPPGDNRLQNKPFDCCIEEYGYEVRLSDTYPTGYKRMHKLAHTKIQTGL
ncbi:hypothetical protein GQ44DRAFT_741639 [Phaeosphaeriaceae sp. PMI808]|nr:hypothetical protein GQ44DRAFT_741639 [Phaeosphaeriaceae sp. PMI808]